MSRATAPTDDDLSAAGAALGARLVSAGLMVATAESCTGGLVARALTETAGSSTWFERGFVTYSNEAKRESLGVSDATLRDHGAVSEPTAREMASGALARSRARRAIAITGIAGPGGGVPGKPVGTVWLAWGSDRSRQAQLLQLPGDRAAVRAATVRTALARLLEASAA